MNAFAWVLLAFLTFEAQAKSKTSARSSKKTALSAEQIKSRDERRSHGYNWDHKGGDCDVNVIESITQSLANDTLLEEAGCAYQKHYNRIVLDEIGVMERELVQLKAENPNASWAKERGGGYKLAPFGLKLPIQLGNKGSVHGPVDSTSHCSGTGFTLFMRTMNRIDGGSVFSEMTPGQLLNFDPYQMRPIVFKAQQAELAELRKLPKLTQLKDAKIRRRIAALSKVKFENDVVMDEYGAFGLVDNSRDGFRSFREAMGQYSPLVQVNTTQYGAKKFEGACPGDFMQWDRPKKGGGHTGAFLKRVNGKVYFYSSNKGTQGYGITCEPEAKMFPKIERLVYPKSLSAIPEFTGKPFLAGEFRHDIYLATRVNEEIEQTVENPSVVESHPASPSHEVVSVLSEATAEAVTGP